MPSRVAEQGLRRGIAERHQHVGIDQFDLALDEGQADLGLLRRRRAVAGRPPGNHIGDVGAAAVEPDRRDHAVQQLARAADERQPLEVFLASGGLADEHDARLRVAVGKHQPRGGRFQRAAVEIFQQRPQRLQRRRGPRRFPRRRRSPPPAPAPAASTRAAGIGGSHPDRSGRGFAGCRTDGCSGASSGSASRLTGSSVSAQSTPASR